MVKVNIKGKEVSIDGYLLKKLESIKYIITKNWDCVILIDGKERSGKSTLGLTIGAYLDPNFSITNVATGAEAAAMKIGTLPRHSVLLIDEGSLVFNSKDSMRAEQKRLVKIMDVVGQKNMVFIIVLPSFFDLNKLIAVRRSKFLLHVYTDKKLNRGRFTYFGEKKKSYLYIIGKKNFGSYSKPRADFYGRFVDFNPLGKEYLRAKDKSLREALQEKDVKSFKMIELKFKKDLVLKLEENMKEEEQKKRIAISGLPAGTYRRILSNLMLEPSRKATLLYNT